jgi:hypothetical protein
MRGNGIIENIKHDIVEPTDLIKSKQGNQSINRTNSRGVHVRVGKCSMVS